MKKDNRGFSLVELIIVIAIMAVMVGMGILSVRLLFGIQAKSCAQKVSGILDETKTGCLSRFDETMTLSYRTAGADAAIKSDGYYAENKVYTINKNADSVMIGGASTSEIRNVGDKKVVIKVYLSDGTNFELGTSKSVTVSYNRSSGAFDPVIVDGVQTTNYIDSITFTSGMKTYTITMVKETGRHVLVE